MITLALALSAAAGALCADPPTTTQPDPASAGAPAQARPMADLAAAATTQPDAAVAAPQGITHLLTRSLPDRLAKRHLELWKSASDEQRGRMRGTVRAILELTQAELEVYIARKNQFDRFSPEIQDRYRQKADLIEQVLEQLSPTEQARLLNMPADQRAKRILELAAELKIQQSRVPPTPVQPKSGP